MGGADMLDQATVLKAGEIAASMMVADQGNRIAFLGMLEARSQHIDAMEAKCKSDKQKNSERRAQHKADQDRRRDKFAKEIEQKREEAKAAAKIINIEASAKFAKLLQEARVKCKHSCCQYEGDTGRTSNTTLWSCGPCWSLMAIEVAVVAMVASALVWGKMSDSQKGTMCSTSTADTMQSMAYYMPSSISEPIIAANRAMCGMIHGLKNLFWYASRAVQFHPHGGQPDFVWLSARTPHGGALYVWCLTARRNQEKCPPEKYYRSFP